MFKRPGNLGRLRNFAASSVIISFLELNSNGTENWTQTAARERKIVYNNNGLYTIVIPLSGLLYQGYKISLTVLFESELGRCIQSSGLYSFCQRFTGNRQ